MIYHLTNQLRSQGNDCLSLWVMIAKERKEKYRIL